MQLISILIIITQRGGSRRWRRLASAALMGALAASVAEAGGKGAADGGKPASATRPADQAADEAPDEDPEAIPPEAELGAPFEMKTIVVTGTRTERPLSTSPTATQVITRAEIERSGAEDLAELLEETPGLQIARSFRGAGVRMQGLDEKYVLVLVDGQRAIGRVDGVLDLSRFAAENIERVEIVRGPSSALYGSDALGGVVHVITRKSTEPLRAGFSGAYGSVGTGDVSGNVGASGKSWRADLSGGWHRARSFRLDPASVATSGSAFQTLQVAASGEVTPSSAFALAARAAYWQRQSDGVDAGAGGATYDRRNATETFEASLSPTLKLGATTLKATLSFSLFRDQFLRDQRGADALDQFQETRERLTQLTLQSETELEKKLVLTVGAEVLDERLDTERIEGGAGARQRLAPFAQLEWKAASWLQVVPGVRADLDSQFGSSVSPKLALRFDPHEKLVLRASAGRGFRAPSFKELYLRFENPSAGYFIGGNTALRPETSIGWSVGLEAQPTARTWLSLTLFRNDIDDLIFPRTVGAAGPGAPTQYRYVNIARAHTQGLDLSAAMRLVPNLHLELGYSLWGSEDEEQRRALEGRPLHRGTLQLRYSHRRYGFDAVVRAAVVGSRPFYEDKNGDGVDETVHADPYLQLDLRVSKRFGSHVTVFVGADNLTGAGHASYLPISPRGVYAGVQGRY